MDLETLDRLLEQVQPPGKIDGGSMLDGYLAAIVAGPCSISPDEWFVDLLGSNGHIATAHGQGLAAITAIANRHNAISNILSTEPAKYAPIFQRADDGTVFAGPWCMGFLAAMQLRWAAWKDLLNIDNIEHGLLLPILLHCTDELGIPMLGPSRKGPETEAFLRNAYHDIPLVVPQIREFWMPQRYSNN